MCKAARTTPFPSADVKVPVREGPRSKLCLLPAATMSHPEVNGLRQTYLEVKTPSSTAWG